MITHFLRIVINANYDGVVFNQKPSKKEVDKFLKHMYDDYNFVCTTEVATKNSLEDELLKDNKVSANR